MALREKSFGAFVVDGDSIAKMHSKCYNEHMFRKETISVHLPNRKHNRRAYRRAKRKLKRLGMHKDSKTVMVATLSTWRCERITKYCREAHLRYFWESKLSKRSSNYRKKFFDSHKPVVFGCYFCAYCGRLVPRGKVTVDHLYPIGKMRKDLKLQKKLKRRGYSNINDPRNLVASCHRCNQAKAARMGSWIRKGRLGRHPIYWWIRHSIRIVILLVFLCFSWMLPAVFVS